MSMSLILHKNKWANKENASFEIDLDNYRYPQESKYRECVTLGCSIPTDIVTMQPQHESLRECHRISGRSVKYCRNQKTREKLDEWNIKWYGCHKNIHAVDMLLWTRKITQVPCLVAELQVINGWWEEETFFFSLGTISLVG